MSQNTTQAPPVGSENLKPDVDTQALEDKIAHLEEEAQALNDKNVRLMAELHNLGTRLRKDFEKKQMYAISGFAKEILDVVDILSAGLENCKDKENEHYKGMEMTLDKIMIILKQYEISKITSLHQPFDHDIHEALTSQETDEYDAGVVIQVVTEGYRFKDRVLRPAKVIVSKKVSDDA